MGKSYGASLSSVYQTIFLILLKSKTFCIIPLGSNPVLQGLAARPFPDHCSDRGEESRRGIDFFRFSFFKFEFLSGGE